MPKPEMRRTSRQAAGFNRRISSSSVRSHKEPAKRHDYRDDHSLTMKGPPKPVVLVCLLAHGSCSAPEAPDRPVGDDANQSPSAQQCELQSALLLPVKKPQHARFMNPPAPVPRGLT